MQNTSRNKSRLSLEKTEEIYQIENYSMLKKLRYLINNKSQNLS